MASNNSPEVWKIGAKPGGRDFDIDEYFSKAIEHGFVTLGWAGTRDVTGKSEKQIASMLKKWNGYDRSELKSNASDLYRFAHISRGAYVVLYRRKSAHIGKVIRSYYWVSRRSLAGRILHGPDYGPHRLGVRWLNAGKEFEIDFSNLARKVLRLRGNSIRKIPKFSALREVEETSAMPVDTGKPPERVKSSITRFIRDTEQSRKLKEEYGNECQVCGEVIQKGNGDSYSEVHHLWPLQDNGPDHITNMLVLCPNHHARFDYRDMGVDKDCKTVVQRKGIRLKRIGSLDFRKGHSLNREYVSRQYSLLISHE